MESAKAFFLTCEKFKNHDDYKDNSVELLLKCFELYTGKTITLENPVLFQLLQRSDKDSLDDLEEISCCC